MTAEPFVCASLLLVVSQHFFFGRGGRGGGPHVTCFQFALTMCKEVS